MYIQHNSNVSSLVIDLMLNLILLVFKYVQNFIKIYKKFKKVQKFHCITPEGNVTECVTKTGEKQIKYTLLKENLKVRMLQLSQGLSRQLTISIWACCILLIDRPPNHLPSNFLCDLCHQRCFVRHCTTC